MNFVILLSPSEIYIFYNKKIKTCLRDIIWGSMFLFTNILGVPANKFLAENTTEVRSSILLMPYGLLKLCICNYNIYYC